MNGLHCTIQATNAIQIVLKDGERRKEYVNEARQDFFLATENKPEWLRQRAHSIGFCQQDVPTTV